MPPRLAAPARSLRLATWVQPLLPSDLVAKVTLASWKLVRHAWRSHGCRASMPANVPSGRAFAQRQYAPSRRSCGMSDKEENRFAARAARYMRVGTNVGAVAARVAGQRLFGLESDRSRNAMDLAAALGGLK